ncbi:DoxX family protein [Solwaraspora sp. WMMD792]|uniref:DoxX family protein n=1 Tax=Micromonosporaceae TaxID=28056 RepID=UPI0024166163|nr:DoxX family protein [Solwaraspora sp. WMMD792]MDG4770719.1 DoxX family protein [Solwaraspora sp. WMMD792]
MNVLLWTCQLVLAIVFIMAGVAKFVVPIPKLRAEDEYTRLFPDWGIRALGVPEVAGALAMILPPLTGVATVLTPVAGVGLAVMMFLGLFANIAVRAARWPYYVLPPALCLMASFVAWGRFGDYQF